MPPTRSPLLIVAAMTAAWLAAGSGVRGQDQSQGRGVEDQGVVANVLSRLLTTPTTRISIGAIEGVLSTNAVINDITIADPDGVWLTLDRAELDWSLTALLRGRLQVSELTLDDLVITRRPLPTEAPEEVAEGPVFPELPVELVVENFTLGRLVLDEPVLGTAAELSATGSAQLVSPEEGLQLEFAGRRLDAEGSLDIGLSYLPQTNILTLNLVHDEPEGGIMARLLELPGLPPVQLQLTGDAPLDDFEADLEFRAGPTIGAQGLAQVDRTGEAYRVDLDVSAQIAGLMPASIAPVFAGTTQLAGDIAFADGGALAVERLRLTSSAVQLELSGTMDAERQLDLTLSGSAIPTPDGGVTRIGEAEVGGLDVDLTVGGMATAPRIAGLVNATGLRLPQGAVETVRAEIEIAPEAGAPPTAPIADDTLADDTLAPNAGLLPDGAVAAEKFRFDVSADAEGVAHADPAMAAALGDSIALVARGVMEIGGATTIDQASIETPTMSATYSGFIAERTTEGVLEAQIPSLAPFSELAGMEFAGSATLTARITGDPLVSELRADLDGGLSEFATGQDAVDGLLGSEVALWGAVRRMRDGFALEGLRLEGANLDVTTNGSATQESADLLLDATIPRLGELHERIDAGQAQIAARLTGSLERPDALVTVTLEEVQAMDRAIPRFVVDVEAQDLTGTMDAALTIEGEVGGKPASGGFQLRESDGGWALESLDITIGSVTASGSLVVGPDLLAQGRLQLRAGELDDLSPLLLVELEGQFDAQADLSIREGAQDAVVAAKGEEVRVAEILLRDFRIDATGQEVMSRPRIDGVAEAGTVTFAGQTFTDVRISGEGTAEATEFSFSAVGDGAIFETEGRLMPPLPGETIPRLDLQDISIRSVEQ